MFLIAIRFTLICAQRERTGRKQSRYCSNYCKTGNNLLERDANLAEAEYTKSETGRIILHGYTTNHTDASIYQSARYIVRIEFEGERKGPTR